MRLGDLVVRFVADMGGWNQGVKQAQQDIDKTTKSTGELGKQSKTTGADLLILGSSVTAAGYACYAAAQKYGGMAQELKDLSYQTDISTQKLQQLQYAALLSGTSFEKVRFGLNQLTLSMADASDPSSQAGKAFAVLGVNPNGKSTEQVFDETAKALSKMSDVQQRNQITNQLFGRSYKEMLPYMESYVTNIKEIEKHKGFTKEELKSLENAKIGWDSIAEAIDTRVGKALSRALGLQEKITNANPLKNPVNKALSWLDNLLFGGEDNKEPEPKDQKVTPPGLNFGDKGFDLAGIYERAKAAFDRLLDSQKEYLGIAQKIKDTEKEALELKRDYISDLKSADIRNPQSIRNLRAGYNKNLSKLQGTQADLYGDLRQAGMKTIAAQRGDDASYSSLSLSIQNVNLSKDYPISSFIKDYEKYQAQQNRSGGVIQR